MSLKQIAIGAVLLGLVLASGCRAPAAPTVAAVATATGAATPSIEATDTVLPSPATPTVVPSAVASATPQPSPTPTPPSPPPPPLQAHEWLAGPVLFRYDTGFCYDICGDFSPYPSLILYSDGRLIHSRYTRVDDRLHVEQSLLTEEEMCAILNTFDAIGLFGYDPTAFYAADDAFPRFRWGADLDVTAWDSAWIPLGIVGDYRPDGLLAAEVPLDAPLLLAYHLVENLVKRPGEAPYVPLELAVSVFTLAPEDDPFICCFASEGGEWPVPAVRLADMAAQGVPNEYEAREVFATVRGPVVEQVLAAFGDDPFSEYNRISFEEDGRRYAVSIRALLPYESLASLGDPSDTSVIPGPDVAATQTSLSCSPEDGVVDFYADVAAAAARDAAILAGRSRPAPLPVETAPPSPKDIFEP